MFFLFNCVKNCLQGETWQKFIEYIVKKIPWKSQIVNRHIRQEQKQKSSVNVKEIE